MPVQWEKAKPYIREKYLEQNYNYRNYSIGPAALQDKKMNIDQGLRFILGVTPRTCKKYVTIMRARCNVNNTFESRFQLRTAGLGVTRRHQFRRRGIFRK